MINIDIVDKIKEDFNNIKAIFSSENNKHVYSANVALTNLYDDINCGLLSATSSHASPFYIGSPKEIKALLQNYELKANISPVAYRLNIRRSMLSDLFELLKYRKMFPYEIDITNNVFHVFHACMISISGSSNSKHFWYKFNQHYFHHFLIDYLELERKTVNHLLNTRNEIKIISEYSNQFLQQSRINNSHQSEKVQSDCSCNKVKSIVGKEEGKTYAEDILETAKSLGSLANKGYVYILINRAIPDYIKIGRTTRMPEVRATELSTSTGVPVPYQVYHAVLVENCSQLENEIHEKLHYCRENLGREFFRLSPEDAKLIIEELSKKYK